MEQWLLYETNVAFRSKQRSKMHLCQMLVDRTELVQMPRQNAQITSQIRKSSNKRQRSIHAYSTPAIAGDPKTAG